MEACIIMKLYVGTYAKYNSGSIFGKWLNLDDYSTRDDFLRACKELHKDEPNPELMFQDCEYENELEKKFYSESHIDESYWDYKEALEQSCLNADIVAEYLNINNLEPCKENIEKADENFHGCYLSRADFVEEFFESDITNLTPILSNNIDWDSVAEELSYTDFDFIELESGKTAVFNK